MDDKSDILAQGGKPVLFAVPRDKFFSRCNIIIDALNLLGRSGAYEVILAHLNAVANGQVQSTISEFTAICLFLK